MYLMAYGVVGRKRIEISRIEDEKKRAGTFQKRKIGLIKKAIELSILCDSEVFLVVMGENDQAFQFGTRELTDIVEIYAKRQGLIEKYYRDDLEDLKPGKIVMKSSESRKSPQNSAFVETTLTEPSISLSKKRKIETATMARVITTEHEAKTNESFHHSSDQHFYWLRAPSLNDHLTQQVLPIVPEVRDAPPTMFRFESNSIGHDSAFYEPPLLRRPSTGDSFSWSAISPMSNFMPSMHPEESLNISKQNVSKMNESKED